MALNSKLASCRFFDSTLNICILILLHPFIFNTARYDIIRHINVHTAAHTCTSTSTSAEHLLPVEAKKLEFLWVEVCVIGVLLSVVQNMNVSMQCKKLELTFPKLGCDVCDVLKV